MPDQQYVTLVTQGGTPVTIANQRGAPYPTTGQGALVFNNGPELFNPILNRPIIIGPTTENGYLNIPLRDNGSYDAQALTEGFAEAAAENLVARPTGIGLLKYPDVEPPPLFYWDGTAAEPVYGCVPLPSNLTADMTAAEFRGYLPRPSYMDSMTHNAWFYTPFSGTAQGQTHDIKIIGGTYNYMTTVVDPPLPLIPAFTYAFGFFGCDRFSLLSPKFKGIVGTRRYRGFYMRNCRWPELIYLNGSWISQMWWQAFTDYGYMVGSKCYEVGEWFDFDQPAKGWIIRDVQGQNFVTNNEEVFDCASVSDTIIDGIDAVGVGRVCYFDTKQSSWTSYAEQQRHRSADGLPFPVTFDTVANTMTFTPAPPDPTIVANGAHVGFETTAPGGASINTLYFIVNASGATCQLSLTEGGAAIDITSNPGGVTVVFRPRVIATVNNVTVSNVKVRDGRPGANAAHIGAAYVPARWWTKGQPQIESLLLQNWDIEGSGRIQINEGQGIVSDNVNMRNADPVNVAATTYAVTFNLAADTMTFTTAPTPALANGQFIMFISGTWPSPVVADTLYYVINAASQTCQLSLTPGGSAIDLGGSPSNVRVSFPALNATTNYAFQMEEDLLRSATDAFRETHVTMIGGGVYGSTGGGIRSSGLARLTVQGVTVDGFRGYVWTSGMTTFDTRAAMVIGRGGGSAGLVNTDNLYLANAEKADSRYFVYDDASTTVDYSIRFPRNLILAPTPAHGSAYTPLIVRIQTDESRAAILDKMMVAFNEPFDTASGSLMRQIWGRLGDVNLQIVAVSIRNPTAPTGTVTDNSVVRLINSTAGVANAVANGAIIVDYAATPITADSERNFSTLTGTDQAYTRILPGSTFRAMLEAGSTGGGAGSSTSPPFMLNIAAIPYVLLT